MNNYWYNTESINNCNEIKGLFEMWKCAQKNENVLETKSCDAFVAPCSYTIDGIISADHYDTRGKKRILLIAKESNEFGNRPLICSDLKCAGGNGFWVAQNINTNKRFINGLAVLCNGLTNPSFGKPSIDKTVLKASAFMNINKRAGFKKCNQEVLNRYFDAYKPFIVREINLINPTDIICCGSGVIGLIKSIIEDINGPSLYTAIHPSQPFVSREKLLKSLKDVSIKVK